MAILPRINLPLPSDDELARAYFSEAIRHLYDSRILHAASRYAGAITSTMKATELGLKSSMTLYGIRGWHDLNTHTVMAVAKSSPVFDSLLNALIGQDPRLVADVEEIEKLVPSKQTLSNLTITYAQNTEYPFVAEEPGLPRKYRLYLPETYFEEARSASYFETAHRLLSSILFIAPEATAWGLILPSSL